MSAYSSLVKANIVHSLTQAEDFAAANGLVFRLAFLDHYISSNPKLEFDPQFMNAAFKLGQTKGRDQSWLAKVPIGTTFLVTSKQ